CTATVDLLSASVPEMRAMSPGPGGSEPGAHWTGRVRAPRCRPLRSSDARTASRYGNGAAVSEYPAGNADGCGSRRSSEPAAPVPADGEGEDDGRGGVADAVPVDVGGGVDRAGAEGCCECDAAIGAAGCAEPVTVELHPAPSKAPPPTITAATAVEDAARRP